MELNEQDVVVELVESSASDNFGKGFVLGGLTTLGIGLGVKLIGKFVVKPLVNKARKKKEEAEWEKAIDTMEKVREDEEED